MTKNVDDSVEKIGGGMLNGTYDMDGESGRLIPFSATKSLLTSCNKTLHHIIFLYLGTQVRTVLDVSSFRDIFISSVVNGLNPGA